MSQDNPPAVKIQETSELPSELLDQILHIEDCLDVGNVQSARILYQKIDPVLLSEHQKEKRIQMIRKYLTFDLAEFIFPCALFIFWFFIAFRTI